MKRTTRMQNMKLAAGLILHDDDFYLSQTIETLGDIPCVAFVSKTPWHGSVGDWERAARTAQEAGATVVLGEWGDELSQREAASAHLLTLGYTHALIPDGDELIEPELLESLVKIAQDGLAERVYVCWDTYWKTPEYVIRPREGFTPCYLIALGLAQPIGGRHFSGGRGLMLGPEHGLVHHLSWVGPEERIVRKLETWGHATEVLPGWKERVWDRWNQDRSLRALHPTHPSAYGLAERIESPTLLAAVPRPEPPEPLRPVQPWPRVSVTIPVYGGAADLARCLESLDPLLTEGLLHEVFVVDDASPNGEEIRNLTDRHPGVRLVVQAANGGFATTCNRGALESSGELLLFLNADTRVPRAGLLRLVEALTAAGPSFVAAGPLTDHASHGQQVAPTFTHPSAMALFAEDFARRDESDDEVDMLVGFCLLVRRERFEALGGFDTRFGRGLFEDNDLCYRLRREGGRLVRARRAFVEHTGSTTLRTLPEVERLLETNQQLYLEKWKDDLQSGFASQLSGMSHERIVFNPSKNPEERIKLSKKRAKDANISLIMIVKNEERVLGECLRSAMPFFAETIIVDTGSGDQTVAIAESFGALVRDFPWTESFAEARNESLRHATGSWVLWLDADDTLSIEAGEAIQQMALSAPSEVMAFVIPVQFVDGDGMPGGTRVDHVKLFRSHPSLRFEGRIHEQILPSLRETFGESGVVARGPGAAVVLHSGYDTSPEGQAKKRERDATILALELAERPDHPFVLFNLGMTDHFGGEHESAIAWLSKCIEVSSPAESHVRKAYALKAISLRELGHDDKSLATLLAGLDAVGEDPELRFHAGFLEARQSRWPQAREHYERALRADVSGCFTSFDTAILGYKTWHNLAQVCHAMGDWNAARSAWKAALTDAPDFLPSAFDLFDGARQVGDLKAAQEMLTHVASFEGYSSNWDRMASALTHK
jgi:glycosyltransferase involved in cell wall biosynthesis